MTFFRQTKSVSFSTVICTDWLKSIRFDFFHFISDGIAYCDTCYRSVVCPSVVCMSSVTLVHTTKAVGQNEMPFSRDTRVVPSSTVLDGDPGAPREAKIWVSEPPLRGDAACCRITLVILSSLTGEDQKRPCIFLVCNRDVIAIRGTESVAFRVRFLCKAKLLLRLAIGPTYHLGLVSYPYTVFICSLASYLNTKWPFMCSCAVKSLLTHSLSLCSL